MKINKPTHVDKSKFPSVPSLTVTFVGGERDGMEYSTGSADEYERNLARAYCSIACHQYASAGINKEVYESLRIYRAMPPCERGGRVIVEFRAG